MLYVKNFPVLPIEQHTETEFSAVSGDSGKPWRFFRDVKLTAEKFSAMRDTPRNSFPSTRWDVHCTVENYSAMWVYVQHGKVTSIRNNLLKIPSPVFENLD